MASRKEEKAEGAARYAADELKSERQEKQSSNLQEQQHVSKEQYGGSTEETHTQEHKPGLISSVIGALGSTYEHAKEAVTGKTHDAAEKTKETAGSVSESLKESHDAAAERAREDAARAREGKDNTAESLSQTKDYTVGKTKDTAGYVADKAVQAKDTTVGKTKDTAGYVADKAVEAKDAAIGKTKDTAGYVADKAGQAKDTTVEKSRDTAGYVVDKAEQAKDVTAEKTKDTAGYVADKAREAKDTTAEKAQQAKDTTAEKAKHAKDAAAEKARQAAGKTGEYKDYAAEKTMEAGEAAKEKDREAMDSAAAAENKEWVTEEEAKIKGEDVYKDTEEEAKSKMEELRLQKLSAGGYDVEDEDAERAKADHETAEIRGKASLNNILGRIGGVTEAVKNKLTMPSDIVEETRKTQGQVGEETASVTIEESPAIAAIDLMKKADEITGQGYTPNDVGKMGEEGTGWPAHRS